MIALLMILSTGLLGLLTVGFILISAKNPAMPRQSPRKYMLLFSAIPLALAAGAASSYAAEGDPVDLAFAAVFVGMTLWSWWWAIRPSKPSKLPATDPSLSKHVSSPIREGRLRAKPGLKWLIGGLAFGIAIAAGPEVVQEGISAQWAVVSFMSVAMTLAIFGLAWLLMPIVMVRLFDLFHTRKAADGE